MGPMLSSPTSKKLVEASPEEYLQVRKEVESELSSRFQLYLKHSNEQAGAHGFAVDQMEGKLAAKEGYAEKLIPNFAVGRRRPTPGNGYLEALTSVEVEFVWGSVESFTETGLVLRGKNYEVDNMSAPRASTWVLLDASILSCASTVKNGKTDGPLVSLHGGSRLHYFGLLAKLRYEKFEWASLCPDPDMTFAWLANGFTQDEQGAQEDLTWFVHDVPKENFISKTPGLAPPGLKLLHCGRCFHL